MNKINLTLMLKEVNSILNALGMQPYAQVHALIADIQTQGSAQLQATQNGQAEVPKAPKKAATQKKKEVVK